MKKIKLLSTVIAMALVPMLITSCGDTETVDPSPTLEFIGGGNYVSGDITLPVGTDFTVGLNASHDKNLESLMIAVSINGGTQLTPQNCGLCDTTLGDKTLRVDFTGTTGNQAGTETWSFTIADKDGNSTTKSIEITVVASGDALFEYEQDNSSPPQPHRVWNFIGPNKGAHQIGQGSVASADPNSWKDIQDSMAASDGSTWPGRWASRNGSTYKKVTGYTWATMQNTVQLETAWTDGGAAEAVINPATGDYYVIKLPGDKYAFIEITDVVSTPSDNLDYIQFRYKYRP